MPKGDSSVLAQLRLGQNRTVPDFRYVSDFSALFPIELPYLLFLTGYSLKRKYFDKSKQVDFYIVQYYNNVVGKEGS